MSTCMQKMREITQIVSELWPKMSFVYEYWYVDSTNKESASINIVKIEIVSVLLDGISSKKRLNTVVGILFFLHRRLYDLHAL